MLADKGMNRAEDGMIRASYGSERSSINKSSQNKKFHLIL